MKVITVEWLDYFFRKPIKHEKHTKQIRMGNYKHHAKREVLLHELQSDLRKVGMD